MRNHSGLCDNEGLRRGRTTAGCGIAYRDLNGARCADVSRRDCGVDVLRAVNCGGFGDAVEVEDGTRREVCAGRVDREGQRAGNDGCGVDGNEVGNWIDAKIDSERQTVRSSIVWRWTQHKDPKSDG